MEGSHDPDRRADWHTIATTLANAEQGPGSQTAFDNISRATFPTFALVTEPFDHELEGDLFFDLRCARAPLIDSDIDRAIFRAYAGRSLPFRMDRSDCGPGLVISRTRLRKLGFLLHHGWSEENEDLVDELNENEFANEWEVLH